MSRADAIAAAASALQDALQRRFAPIPNDWFTREQYQEHKGIGKTAAGCHLASGRKSGLLESQEWTVRDALGRASRVTIYRLKKD